MERTSTYTKLQNWVQNIDDQIAKEQAELDLMEAMFNERKPKQPKLKEQSKNQIPTQASVPQTKKLKISISGRSSPVNISTRSPRMQPLKAQPYPQKSARSRNSSQLTGRSSISNPVDERLHRMASVYNHRQETARSKAEQIENQKIQDRPKINDKSRAMARRRSATGQKVEDRLTEHGQRTHRNADRANAVAAQSARDLATPKINPRAQNTIRKGNVADRLQQYGETYQSRQEMRREATEPRFSFKPVINKTKFWDTPNTSSCMNRSSSVQAIYSAPTSVKGSKRKNSEPQPPTFNPSLSQRSLKIAERMGKSYERLTTSVSKKPVKAQQVDTECSFTPRINKDSIRIDQKHSKITGPRWKGLYDRSVERRAEQDTPKENEKDLDWEQCTFAPKLISKTALTPSNNVADRCKEWAAEQEMKTQMKREEVNDQTLEDCTFKPDTKKENTHLKNEPYFKHGTRAFLERQDRARAMSAEKITVFYKHDGSNWKNQTTVPMDMNLRTENRGRKKSPGAYTYSTIYGMGWNVLHDRIHNY